MKTNTFVESHPYKDKNLTMVEIFNAEVCVVTHGNYEDCKIVHLEIRDENGKVQKYNYWKMYEEAEESKVKELLEKIRRERKHDEWIQGK